jgi:hypothetical protein
LPPNFIVTIDRPFYPKVAYCDSMEEAEILRDQIVEEENEPDGYNEVRVTIAQVVATTEIKTHF